MDYIDVVTFVHCYYLSSPLFVSLVRLFPSDVAVRRRSEDLGSPEALEGLRPRETTTSLRPSDLRFARPRETTTPLRPSS